MVSKKASKVEQPSPPARPSRKILKAALGIISTILLVFSLIGAGLFVCSAPNTTETLSRQFSSDDKSPFTKDELVEAALATLDYTLGSHSKDALLDSMYKINLQAFMDGRAQTGLAPDISGFTESEANGSLDELEARLMLADESYMLSTEAISHLDDVNQVIELSRIAIIWAALFSLAGCIALAILFGRKTLGFVLRVSALIVIASFVGLACWVLMDFNGFFEVFHSLFFTDGTWTFRRDSLLICMYPSSFWMGMGAVWLAATTFASFLCFILGRMIGKKMKV